MIFYSHHITCQFRHHVHVTSFRLLAFQIFSINNELSKCIPDRQYNASKPDLKIDNSNYCFWRWWMLVKNDRLLLCFCCYDLNELWKMFAHIEVMNDSVVFFKNFRIHSWSKQSSFTTKCKDWLIGFPFCNSHNQLKWQFCYSSIFQTFVL